MAIFDLPPSKEVGDLKSLIREAVIEGTVPNTLVDGYNFIITEGEKLGFRPDMSFEEIEEKFS